MGFSAITELHTTTYADLVADTTGEAISASGKTLFTIEMDNGDNVDDEYVKLYDKATAATTSDFPDFQLKVPAGQRRTHVFNGGDGLAFGTGLSIRATSGKAHDDSASPAKNLKVVIKTN